MAEKKREANKVPGGPFRRLLRGVFRGRSRRRGGLGVLTPIILIVMGAGIVLQGIGQNFGNDAGASVEVEKTTIIGTISETMERAGLAARVAHLTESRNGEIDILIASAADCSYCQRMVSDGLDEIVRFAENRELGLGFLPVVRGPASALAAGIEACLLEAESVGGKPGLRGAGDIRDVYALIERISNESQAERQKEMVEEFGQKVLGRAGLLDCASEQAASAGDHSAKFVAEFGMAGTPSFYILSNGEIVKFAGYGGAEATIERIEHGLSSRQPDLAEVDLPD